VPQSDDAWMGEYYRRHRHLSRTELYRRARERGVPEAAKLSHAELIHALAESEARAVAAA
jgi:hypothetical protein